MHQVFCRLSTKSVDVRCPICRQGFLVCWSRYSAEEREESRRLIEACLRDHHDSDQMPEPAFGHQIGYEPGNQTGDRYQVHPATGFNVPAWFGAPSDAAADLLALAGDEAGD